MGHDSSITDGQVVWKQAEKGEWTFAEATWSKQISLGKTVNVFDLFFFKMPIFSAHGYHSLLFTSYWPLVQWEVNYPQGFV